jgi:hypothetical protein
VVVSASSPGDSLDVNGLALTPAVNADNRNPKANFQIRTVYKCDNGDTLVAQKHVFIQEDGSSTGPITLHGGTGLFTELSGHGVNNGTPTGEGTAVGDISGVFKLRQ